MTSTYGTILNNLQSTVYNIIKNDSTVQSKTTNVMDGVPAQMIRGVGFPYILVHTPEGSEERVTITKFKVNATVHIEVVSKTESIVRETADAVRDALRSNQSTTRTEGHFMLKLPMRGRLNQRFLPNEKSKPVWTYDLFVTYFGVFS